MFLENLVLDAADPLRVGRFWAAALGARPLTVTPELYEARLELGDGCSLDLCIPQVPEVTTSPLRLHMDLLGGPRQQEIAERLRGLGAADLDIGQQDVAWIVLGDPEQLPFCVMEERSAYTGTGPIAALPLDSADVDRDAAFWARLTGWTDAPGVAPRTLRHPSGHGPLLELCPEPAPKQPGEKNRVHLDVRLEAGEDPDAAAALVAELGGRELAHDWGALPWRVYQDPSGNEFCILPAP
ncbi:VOC family protein [Brachybacterium aquaticum]|uniref:Glyoxalase-like domain-containing protein n=1 Tax=Brachybacterium aquaticum TaxID=1432564 RepID=A0A841AGN5_9MICO|nr:VOC family protein [Brachybacterium aquaticum]MBB5832432.1 hypothetical protein [Brachybacterium aquaticum]